MRLESWQSLTISEAKSLYEHGVINQIRVDVMLGDFVLMVKTDITERPIRTHRYEYKKYKSLDAILKDYQYITSQEVKSLILK
ncbi:hypothetical protein [Acinetobacter sp. neg1]|uniref:hypothetical protein n=1 Tax=Acinetobacter sp. neg1 TaxID=1561068 RepID=UPI0006474206|nr:hypothetical protein [Acinetobacter sp. neg1]